MARKGILTLVGLGALVGLAGYGAQLLLVELLRCHGELAVMSTRAAGL